ncbi:hypothetical protein [Vibrio sp. SCSIO 43137]|nr:hypothetical protein [Vibrio sp. SCSIO 43137]WCE30368.1 hypothetical protein PK654_03530 [Vibrio sp. SCSIO 43137]
MFRKKLQRKRLTSISSANRRKRMQANNKKKIIWRHRAFVQSEAFADE